MIRSIGGPTSCFFKSLGKYLDIKIDAKQIDFMYHYAQVSLLHYADWMLKHEVRLCNSAAQSRHSYGDMASARYQEECCV
jgi:hypothetical protein